MRRYFPITVALLLFLLVLLVLKAPARLLPALLPSEQVILQGLSGSVWRGQSSRSLLRIGNNAYVQLGHLQWRLRPWSLLLLSPTVELESRWGEQRISANVAIHSGEDFELQALDANINAELLKHLAPLALDGRLSLQIAQLRLQQGWPAGGEGRLVWQQAVWSAPRGRLPLGSYVLEFKQADADAALSAEVLTLSGPLQAEGSMTLKQQIYALDLNITAEGGLDPSLRDALSLVATPQAEGFHLKINGALAALK
ncbi:type II secretion system protein N [Parahaliea sp. F7430]|uniref:Type II secretion system protein N n=1 Tax=Sediminihaliea albiluteola TaxID=2758564 RepID=A0A7W2TVU2_9GAMM|nr:type II secretion system protein N [Sediminihaliea albiluteola]MBA6412905.1 type II secretion system protein N [Sediminihaliea albiluteola]